MFLLYGSRMNNYKTLTLNLSNLSVSILAIFLAGCSSGVSSEQLQDKIDSGNPTQISQQQTTQIESPATNSETVGPKTETMPDEPKLTLTISGDNGNTPPFFLSAGNYKVESIIYKKCIYDGTLYSVDTGYVIENVFSSINEIKTGETYLYNIEEGDYYINSDSNFGGCPWDVTFTQQ